MAKISFGKVLKRLSLILGGVQMPGTLTSGELYLTGLGTTVPIGFLLQETGDNLLQENGDKLLR